MKILSCITDVFEIPYVVKAGADEIYFAVSWINSYSNGGVLKDFKELKKAISISKKLKINYHLAINDFRFSETNDSYKILKKTLSYGINSVIVSNIALSNYLSRNFENIKIHISSLVSAMNIETLEFLYNISEKKISRLIFPNHISAFEAKPLIDWCKSKNIETEVFFFRNFGCTFLNGFCYLHGNRYFNFDFSREGSICKFGKNNFIAEVFCKDLSNSDTKIRSRIVERLNYGTTPRILTAASFLYYYNFGVDFVKYGSRTDDTKNKIQNIIFIKSTLNMISDLISKYGFNRAKEIFLEKIKKI